MSRKHQYYSHKVNRFVEYEEETNMAHSRRTQSVMHKIVTGYHRDDAIMII